MNRFTKKQEYRRYDETKSTDEAHTFSLKDMTVTLKKKPSIIEQKTPESLSQDLKKLSIQKFDRDPSPETKSIVSTDIPENVSESSSKTPAKRPQLSQRAKQQLLASIDRPQSKVNSTLSSKPSTFADAPEFVPGGIGLYPLYGHHTESIQFGSLYPTQVRPKATPQMAVQQVLTSSGHYVLMTENGLMVPPSYAFPQYYPTQHYDMNLSQEQYNHEGYYYNPYGYAPTEEQQVERPIKNDRKSQPSRKNFQSKSKNKNKQQI
jgi:hypothetical protein